MLYELIKPVLFSLDPERSHHLTFKLFKQFSCLIPTRHYDCPARCFNLDFPNPLGLAAGLDKNGTHLDLLAKLGFGFIEIGTVTPRPQPGNPKPRLFRLKEDEALINRFGFNSLGIDQLISNIQKSNYQGILGINIGKNADTPIELALNDYLIGLEKTYPYASYITVNISSPNTQNLRMLQTENYLSDFLKSLKQKQSQLQIQYQKSVPLLIKIAPDLSEAEIETMADCFLKNKIEGMIATNTLVKKPQNLKSAFKTEIGGLSGHPLFNQSLKTVQGFSKALNYQIPIIAAGGIDSPERAQQMLDAGASLIQIYTGLIYQGPKLISTILKTIQTH